MNTTARTRYQRDQGRQTRPHDEIVAAAEREMLPPATPHGLARSFGFALDGIRHTIRTQRNFRIQLACAAIAIGAGAALRISHMEWIIVVAMIGLVLSLELINTALEAVVDMITADYHPLAKVAKDASAAAVLIASVLSVVVAGIIYVPYVVGIMGK